MIKTATHLNPGLRFERANMLDLHYSENSFSAALAFYAIVHFTNEELDTAFTQINRILKKGSSFLLSFHIGKEVVKAENFLDKGKSLDFRFFETENIIKILNAAGFKEESVIERFPYMDFEYPSKRAYIWCYKNT
jgi:SAM-dependent methyltransferase